MTRPMLVTAPLRDGYRTCFVFGQAGNAVIGTGTSKFILPWDCTFVGAIAVCTTPPGASTPLIADLNYDGTSIYAVNQSKRPTIAVGDTTSQAEQTPDTVDGVKGHVLTCDIDSIGGSGSPGTYFNVVVNLLVAP